MTENREELERFAYRVFFLGENDKVLGRLDLQGPSTDQAAIKETHALRYRGICELWHGPRFVRRFEPYAD